MTELNSIQCGETLRNTGQCGCPFDPKLIIGKIMIPVKRVLTKAELNDIQATLEGLVEAAKSSRIYPVQGMAAITDNTEEPTFQTFGYGSSAPVKEGNYNWIFELPGIGVDNNNALRSFNGTSRYAEIYFDNKNRLIGTVKKDVNGDNGLAGVPQMGGYPYTYPWKAGDGTNNASYRTQSVFLPQYVNENIAYFEVPMTTYLLSELAGLVDIKLAIAEADEDADTVDVTGTTDCGATNLYELFADELDQDTAWIVKGSDGVVKAATVAKNDAINGWKLTYTTDEVEDGDTITLAAPAVLAAAPINVSGYESDTVTVSLGS